MAIRARSRAGDGGARIDPLRAFNFAISLQQAGARPSVGGVVASTGARTLRSVRQAGFSECSGLDLTLEVESRREGGNNGTVLQFPTRVTWSNLRLKRGLALSDDLWHWHYDFVQGRFASRRDGLIVLQNEQGEAVKTWAFRRGLPVKWSGPSLSAGNGELAFEEIEIAHEGIELLRSGATG